MRLATSTLGTPELTLAESASVAAQHGYSGLELRSGPGATVETTAPIGRRRRWRQDLERHDMVPLSIASYVRVCSETLDDEAVTSAAVAEAQLAHDLGCPWLRVFPGGPRDRPVDAGVDSRGARRLAAIAAAVEGLGVTIAIETHDSHPRADDVLRLIGSEGCARVAVIWDVLHTWLAGEAPAETASALAGRLAYVQVKDVSRPGDLSPISLGRGALPLRACLSQVRVRGLSDWVSWEYERAWHLQAPEFHQVAGPGRRWLESALAGPA